MPSEVTIDITVIECKRNSVYILTRAQVDELTAGTLVFLDETNGSELVPNPQSVWHGSDAAKCFAFKMRTCLLALISQCVHEETIECQFCKGSGKVRTPGFLKTLVPCGFCEQSGRLPTTGSVDNG